MRGAVDHLDFPGTDPEVRARLEEELAAHGPGPLHTRLAAADPEAAAAILPSNGRRIVRALEVIEITGRPFTANLPRHDSVYDTVQIGVDVARPELDARIADRVDRMWAAGLVDEVRALEAEGLREGVPPPAPSATSRCSPPSRGSAPTRRHVPRRSAPPNGSPAARTPGSAATRASTGSAVPPPTGRNSPAGPCRCSNERSQPDHVMASGRSTRHRGT